MKKSIVAVLSTSTVLVGFAMQNLALAEQQCDPGKPETSASRFKINQTNGTAFDIETKLIWKICAEGQIYSDRSCTGNATNFTWDKAIKIFDDKGDSWRLPNADELNSIVKGGCRSPAINQAIFPDAPNSPFWSSSSDTPNQAHAWAVDFSNGSNIGRHRSYDGIVRLVRGGQWFDLSVPLGMQRFEDNNKKMFEYEEKQRQAAEAAQAEKNAFVTCQKTSASRFKINQTNGTAFDIETKLIWKICAEGQIYSDRSCTGNATNFTWDKAIKIFDDKGDSWRLPNADELNSIVKGWCRSPAINQAIFPDTPNPPFWSSSLDTPNQAHAWAVDFSNGSNIGRHRSYDGIVRLVRGGQWFDLSVPLGMQRFEDNNKKMLEYEEKQRQAAEAAQAEKNAFVTCKNKAICDKTFSLTQIYINSKASQKIQVATDTIIETYNPTENGNIGMSAIKIPGKGSSAAVRLSVACKVDESGIYDTLCGLKKQEIYNGFRPFVNKMLGD